MQNTIVEDVPKIRSKLRRKKQEREGEREKEREAARKINRARERIPDSKQATPRSVRPEKPRAATVAKVTCSRFHLARHDSAHHLHILV